MTRLRLKNFIFRTAAAPVFCLLLGMPAAQAMEDIFSAQQQAVESPGGGMKVVTPLNDCLDKLPEEEAELVRRNYLKPYQECLMRLQALEARGGKAPAGRKGAAAETKKSGAKTAAAAEEEDAEPAPAQTPRNFVRVRPDDGPRRPAQFADTPNPAESARPRPAWDTGYNR